MNPDKTSFKSRQLCPNKQQPHKTSISENQATDEIKGEWNSLKSSEKDSLAVKKALFNGIETRSDNITESSDKTNSCETINVDQSNINTTVDETTKNTVEETPMDKPIDKITSVELVNSQPEVVENALNNADKLKTVTVNPNLNSNKSLGSTNTVPETSKQETDVLSGTPVQVTEPSTEALVIKEPLSNIAIIKTDQCLEETTETSSVGTKSITKNIDASNVPKESVIENLEPKETPSDIIHPILDSNETVSQKLKEAKPSTTENTEAVDYDSSKEDSVQDSSRTSLQDCKVRGNVCNKIHRQSPTFFIPY